MKRKPLLSEIVKIIINCAILPLYFIKFYHEVAVLPGFDADGNHITHRIDHYYSIYYKLDREELAYLLWLAVAVAIASVAMSLLRIAVKDGKKLKIASNIIFGISVAFFLVLLFISLQISYKY